jgi:hypothetical protein
MLVKISPAVRPVVLEKPYVRVLDVWFDNAHGTRPGPPAQGASR